MLGSPILDIALGLIFVFLLYSLLATTVMELLASLFGLRARLLRSTIYRMLNDDQAEQPLTLQRLMRELISFVCFFLPPRWRWLQPQPTFAWAFYNMPAIKYLGLSSWFKRPSFISPDRFSKTVCDLLKGSDVDNESSGEERLQAALLTGQVDCGDGRCHVGPETLRFLRSLWMEVPAENQTREENFRLQLTQWYNETIELLSVRYKRRMQLNTFVLGFLIAVVFNVNTVEISARLARNDDAREALVTLAGAWIENRSIDSVNAPTPADSVLPLNQMVNRTIRLLEDEVAQPNNLLALGYDIPDSFIALSPAKVATVPAIADSTADTTLQVVVASSVRDSNEVIKALHKVYQRRCRQMMGHVDNRQPLAFNVIHDGPCQALPYGARLMPADRLWYVAYRVGSNYSLFGFLITAIAISLGAPFWFDLLNKVVKIKNEAKKS